MTIDDLPPRYVLERLSVELTARQYDVFLLRVVHEHSYARIGVMLGLSKQTVMQHDAAARRRIGKMDWERR